jgi:hypothetical protein
LGFSSVVSSVVLLLTLFMVHTFNTMVTYQMARLSLSVSSWVVSLAIGLEHTGRAASEQKQDGQNFKIHF